VVTAFLNPDVDDDALLMELPEGWPHIEGHMDDRPDTGKNDLTQRVTHREAVFGTVIHSIFDAWDYEVLWTYVLS